MNSWGYEHSDRSGTIDSVTMKYIVKLMETKSEMVGRGGNGTLQFSGTVSIWEDRVLWENGGVMVL
jgi:hypothetical protein